MKNDRYIILHLYAKFQEKILKNEGVTEILNLGYIDCEVRLYRLLPPVFSTSLQFL